MLLKRDTKGWTDRRKFGIEVILFLRSVMNIIAKGLYKIFFLNLYMFKQIFIYV